jgi:small basic protein (TIGR04137 family)
VSAAAEARSCRAERAYLSYFFRADSCLALPGNVEEEGRMSIDKSLRRKDQLQRARNVLTRGERIKRLTDEERWQDGRSPYGLPKVKVIKLVVKKAKKAKEEEKAEGEGGEAAPAAAAAAPEKKGAPEKKAEKK